ncbi:Hpt domain-containing protein [Steroidobacter sp. S1-65]|uniref:histidine kinase n=1 Tax=Steroidobacter gossypii TaxID=2805490 RepID=A0ABS1X2Z1_9GAMM|nr:Hpt domain-containing protein [Steroidobacter gossypii]MBM0107591.1 Hpt domain-containing protein [Steroidobacter gossypii]
MAEVSSQTLHIVARELASELNEARASLEAFGEQQDNLALLRKCNEHLHAVHGALRVAEVYGAALLAEEMGQVANYLISNFNEKRHLAEGLDALMRAMVQLPTYLERVMSGGRDMALVLLPLLNDLRAVRGHALLSEGTLLLLNLSSDQQANPAAAAAEGALTVAQWARKLRTRFQLGLLGWIKGERIDQNLEILSRTAEKLEHVATTQAVFQLWWVVGSILEALREGGLEGSASVKRLLGQADREMKRLYESGEARYADSPPLELLNNLLYYVARARTNGPRVAAVRASFRLSELLPVDEGVEQARESLSAPSVKLMKTVAAAIKEDLSRVKDALDIFVRQGGTQVDELAPQLELLKKIADTLGVLGLGDLRDKVQAETTDLQAIVAQKSSAGEGTLLRMAATLIKVEDSLDEQLVGMIVPTPSEAGAAPAKPAGPDDIEFRLVTEAVLRECIVNMARIKEAIAHSLDKPREGQAVDQIPQLMRGITAGLLMLGKTRVVEIMEGIDKALQNFVRSDGMTLPQEAVDRLADAIVAVEYYMETIQAGRADPWYMLDNAESCLQFLAEAQPIPRVEAYGPTADHARTVVIEPHAPTVALGTEHEPTAVLDPVTQEVRRPTKPAAAPPPPPPAPMPPALTKPVDREVDPEFVELFIEEAKDEIAKLNQFFPLWDSNPQDQDALVNVRRSFHTLKGSGRMVGAQLIGDFAWSIENMLNRVINKTLDRTPDMMGVMRSAVAAVPELVEQLETGRAPQADIAKIINTANNLAGVRPSAAPAAAPAAPAPKPAPRAPEPPVLKAPVMEAPTLSPLPEKKTASEVTTPAAASAESPMDPGLHEIYAKETAGHLATIRKFIASCGLATAPYVVTEDLHRSCHTLSGTAKTAGARQGIKIAEPLNRYVRKLYDNSIGMSDAGLAVLTDAVGAIQQVVDNINENTGFFLDHDVIVRRLVELEQALDADISRLAEMGSLNTAGGFNTDATGEILAATASTSINERLNLPSAATGEHLSVPSSAFIDEDAAGVAPTPATQSDEALVAAAASSGTDLVPDADAIEIEEISLAGAGLDAADPETFELPPVDPSVLEAGTLVLSAPFASGSPDSPSLTSASAENALDNALSDAETTLDSAALAREQSALDSAALAKEQSAFDSAALAGEQSALDSVALDGAAHAGDQVARDSAAISGEEITLDSDVVSGKDVGLDSHEIAGEGVGLDSHVVAGKDIGLDTLVIAGKDGALDSDVVAGRDGALDSDGFGEEIKLDAPEVGIEEIDLGAPEFAVDEINLDEATLAGDDITGDAGVEQPSVDSAVEEISLDAATLVGEDITLDAGDAKQSQTDDAVAEITLDSAALAGEEVTLDSAVAGEEISIESAALTGEEITLAASTGETEALAEEIVLGAVELTPEEVTAGESAMEVVELDSDASAMDTLQWAYEHFPTTDRSANSDGVGVGEVQIEEAALSADTDLTQESAALEELANPPEAPGILVDEVAASEGDRSLLQMDEPLPEEASDIVAAAPWAGELPVLEHEATIARDDAETIRSPFLRPAAQETLQAEASPAAEPAVSAAAPVTPTAAAAVEEEEYDDSDFDPDVAAIFTEEATELLETADQSLSSWIRDRANTALVFELKRVVHTLKGGARMAGIRAMGDLSHELETLMGLVETGQVPAEQEVFDTLQTSLDELHRMRDVVAGGERCKPARALMNRIRALSGQEVEAAPVAPPAAPTLSEAVPTAAAAITPATPVAPEVVPPAALTPQMFDAPPEEIVEIESYSPDDKDIGSQTDIVPTLTEIEALNEQAAAQRAQAEAASAEAELPAVSSQDAWSDSELATFQGDSSDATAESADGGWSADAVEETSADTQAPSEEGGWDAPEIEAVSDVEVEFGADELGAVAPREAVRVEETPAPATNAAHAATGVHAALDVAAVAPELPPDAADQPQQEEAAAEAQAPALPGREKPTQQEPREFARVDADLLDNLLNNAGEVSIFRSRMEQQVSSIEFNLAELGRTVTRLKEQLRKLELETESQILHRHQEQFPDRADFDPLEMDRYSTIQQLTRAFAESVSDVSSIEGLLENLTREAQNLLLQQSRVVTEMQNGLMRTRMVPFQRHVQRLSRLVRQVANDTNKRVELVVQGANGELDRQVLERMLPPFEHMLRNSVVHGIEMPDERVARGKPAQGTIKVGLHREGSEMVIVLEDDGRGIDVNAVRERARQRGLLQPGRVLTDEEAMQLILEPGFSTASNVTQHAGRGVGMDVVVNEIKKLGGALFTASEPGKGVKFTIRLPFTLAITQALIVRTGDELYALPLPSVEGVARISKSEVEKHLAEDVSTFNYGGQIYKLQHLGAFVGGGPSALPELDVSVPLILIRAGEHSTALVTDELVGSREMVVKSVGPQIATIRGIAGATILGDGRIVIILDMNTLVRTDWRGGKAPLETQGPKQDMRTFALVVDDSITVRRVTQRLLERNGMRVMTAKDGVDALSILQEHIPDVILLDIEMPRMDGYELATQVRADARLTDIPIVMITSRVGEKHRARAIEIGVNDYLGKPYQENQLLDAIEPLVQAARKRKVS